MVLESFLGSMVLYLCVMKTFLLLAIILIDYHGFSIVNSVNEVLYYVNTAQQIPVNNLIQLIELCAMHGCVLMKLRS